MAETTHTKVELLVGGLLFGGWMEVEISRALDRLVGEFELSVLDKWAETGETWEIKEGAECSVLADGVPLITGQVDDVEIGLSGSSHSITVKGRDRAAKLADCSVDMGAWEFSSTNLLSFLTKLGAHFGVTIALGPGASLPTIPEKKISVTPGDTGFAVLDRIARFAGLLPVSDGIGGVLLITPGKNTVGIGIDEGDNVVSASSSFSRRDRFEKYVVLGQEISSDEVEGESATAIRAEVTDPEMAGSGRTLVIQAETATSQAKAKARAIWEASVRAARSESLTVDVNGWKPTPGYIWTPGDLVQSNTRKLRVNGTMMLGAVSLKQGSGGEVASLTLQRPDAFAAELPEERSWKQ